MDYQAIIGMIGQLAGSAAGQAASQMDKDQLMALIKGVVDDYGNIKVPDLQKLLLSKAPDTELSKIKDDPAYRSQQMAADSQLNDIINSGGLTLSDKAALNAIQAKIQRGESAGRNAIEGQMAAHGTLDSGAQLAMQLANQQNSANNQAAAGAQTAGDAQMRAYNAILQRGQNAGQGLDRSYRQQSNAASAQDAINQGNTSIMNTAARYNAGLGQQNFQNQMGLAAGKAGPAYALAGAHGANAKDTQQQGAAAGNMAGQAVGAGVNAWQNSGAGNSSDSNSYAGRGSASDLSGGHTDELGGTPTRPQTKIVDGVSYHKNAAGKWEED